MGDETKTGTEAGAADQGKSGKTAPEKTAETEDRSKDLENRLAQSGREKKAQTERAEAAEAELARLQDERDQLWYEHKATDAEKEAFRTKRNAEKQNREDPEKVNLANENALLKAIAQESNPVAKKALTKMFEKAEKTKRFPDAAAVSALRESFEDDEPEDDTTKEPEGKTPPKVSASRGTTTTEVPLETQIEDMKKLIKQGKAKSYDLLPLLQQRDQQRAAARAS